MPTPQQRKAQPPVPPRRRQPRYVALYDYTAADDDEVSFQESKDSALRLSLSHPSPPPSPLLSSFLPAPLVLA